MPKYTTRQVAGVIRAIAIVAVLTFLARPVFAEEGYLRHIDATVAGIEKGEYDRAAESLRKALALDANDPLSHLCLGTIYLHVGQSEQAVMEYKVALGLSKDDPLALYGLGMSLLARPDLKSAAEQFGKIAPGSDVDPVPALAYLRALKGDYTDAAEQVAGKIDGASVQMRAMALFQSDRFPEAKDSMQALVNTLPDTGFDEMPGVVMTFVTRVPAKLTGRPLAKPFVPPAIEEATAPRVSGTTRLKADLSRAKQVKYVLFYVDERVVGIVNHTPYECYWDTTRYQNGLHTVKIEGQTADNQPVNQRATKVRVQNRAVALAPLSGGAVDTLRSRLWERMRLLPSRATAHYVMAKCAEEQGDEAEVVLHLEKVMAANPGYLDARVLLREAYEPLENYRELRQGPKNGGKLIALTFDDGPNPNTGKILDTLQKAGVKATFFVVGQRAEENREMMERMHREGHEIESHTYAHRNFEYLPVSEIEKELFGAIATIREATGRRSVLFRPPGGHLNGNGKRAAGSFGLLPVFWTANCSNYEGTTVETIVRYVSSSATPGGIVLMHNAENMTVAALPAAIDALRSKGYRFVTVSDMFFGR